jgi:ketosteroid isomerase-like protein
MRPVNLFIALFCFLPGLHLAASEKYADLLEQARAKSRQSQWAEAVPLWKKVVEQNPTIPDHWRQLADAHYRMKDYRASITAHEKAMELGAGFRWGAAHNIACCYALLGEKDQALHWLEKSLQLGHRNLRTVETEEDFKSLREEPRFRELVGLADVAQMSRDDGWRYDLKLLHREILRRHPNPFRQQSKEQTAVYVQKLHDEIPKLTDAQVEIGLMKLARMAADGHTFIRPALPRKVVAAQFFQFQDGVFITAAAPEHADIAGAQVLKVGDHPVDKVIASLDVIVSQDNTMGLKSGGPFFLGIPRFLHGLGLIPTEGELPLTIRDAKGKERQITLPASKSLGRGHAMADKTWVTARTEAKSPVPLYLKDREQAYWFEHLPKEKLVYCQYNGVRNQGSESFAKFCERMFKFINTNEVEYLVLDLRWNGGGNSFLNRSLIHGLIRCEKINQRGKLFVIIGRNTFSAAQNCTTDIEMHTDATFVGEPTGSCPNFIGESVTITLPYSKMTGSVSDLNWVRSWPMDQRCWIAPQIYAPPVFALYKENRDPALEAILDQIKGKALAATTPIAAEAQQKNDAPPKDMREDVAKWNRAMEDAMKKGDLQGVANFYADNALLLGPNGYSVSGRKAIDEYWTKLQSPKDWKLDVLSVEGGKGVIIQRGRSKLVYAPEGKERVSQVEFVLVWQQQKDGSYKIAVDAYW